MTQGEIGRGKSGRRAYALDEIGIVPSRRTRHPEEVSIAWQIDAYRFELPLVVAPMDSVVSPATAVEIGRLGGLAALDLEGLWTRFDDPEPLLAEAAALDDEAATRRLQEIYAEPIKEDLIGRRIEGIRAAGVTTAARLSPQQTVRYHKAVLDAGAGRRTDGGRKRDAGRAKKPATEAMSQMSRSVKPERRNSSRSASSIVHGSALSLTAKSSMARSRRDSRAAR